MNPITTREALLLAILHDGEKYGRAIRDECERRGGHKLPLGSLYTTLARMEEKGFVRSRTGESSVGRGGNRRTYYRIMALGEKALAAYMDRIASVRNLAVGHV